MAMKSIKMNVIFFYNDNCKKNIKKSINGLLDIRNCNKNYNTASKNDFIVTLQYNIITTIKKCARNL